MIARTSVERSVSVAKKAANESTSFNVNGVGAVPRTVVVVRGGVGGEAMRKRCDLEDRTRRVSAVASEKKKMD